MADEDRPSPPSQGTIGPTSASILAAAFVVAVVSGYALAEVAVRMSGTAPRVEWTAIGALVVIAGVQLVLAYTTYRTVHRERRLIEPRRAVNLLLLAKASALVGALIAGGYLGFALPFVNQLDVDLPRERVVRALIAAVTGVAIVVFGLLLERACRIPKGDAD